MSKLLGHPLHPVFVHFPIACWSLASIFDLVDFLALVSVWEIAGVLHVIGTLSAIVAMFTGLLDFTKIPDGKPLVMKTANTHMLLVMTAWCFYACSVFLRLDDMHLSQPGMLAVVLSQIGAVILMAAGWFGGKLVYTHKVGVN